MKFIIALLILSAQLFALTIVLNSGKESKINYAILHLMDTQPFTCETIPDALEKKRYLCKADHPFNKPIEPKKMKFAELSFYAKEGSFYMAIEPKIDSKLIPVEDTLYETTEVLSKPKAKQYRHWMILLQEEPLYKDKVVQDGLDFPIIFEKYQKPYIGALDLNGAPISYAQSKDIGLYLDMKRLYEKGDYAGVVDAASRVLEAFPLSIFRSEIELYAMRAMDKLLSLKGEEKDAVLFDEEAIIAIAKRWTKEFTSDENLPEVFMLMTKSYLKLHAKADANYFIDILVSEHPESPYTKKAILFFADTLLPTKEKEKALKLYLDVLYSVKDIDIASEAAIRLSDYQIDVGKIQEAKEYLLKVLNVNANFLLKDKEASYTLAKRLHDHKLYDVAARILDMIVEHTPKTDEKRESLLKENGDWHAKAGDVEKAHKLYQEYLDTYRNGGEYVDEVKERLDELFFKRTENNETILANYYDKLIQNYTANAIGEKALIEKAKLLLKQGEFQKVLELEESLLKAPDAHGVKPEELIYEAAKSQAIKELEKGACQEVVRLVEQYKLHIEGAVYEEKLFGCFMRLARYERAKEISVLHVKDTKLDSRFVWTQRYANVLFKLSKHEEVRALKEDLQTMAKTLKTSINLETLRDLFFSSIVLKHPDEALAILQVVEERYPNTFTTIDLHNEIIKIASESKNDLLLISHAQKILALQKQFKSSPLSPMIEFNYIEALKRLGRDREALEVIQAIPQERISLKDKIRFFYYAGELSLKLGEKEKAKAYFTQCVENNETSSWKNICQENLKLF